MDSKRTIGLIFSYNENWIGGTYYVQNLIHSLSNFFSEEAFKLVIYGKDLNTQKVLQKIGYGDLPFKVIENRAPHFNIWEKGVNKLSQLIHSKQLIIKRDQSIVPSPLPDIMFPLFTPQPNLRGLYWIPDFQDVVYPEFFSEEERASRQKKYANIIRHGKHLILSSQDAFDTFMRLYPQSMVKPHLLRFAVTHPPYKELSSKTLFKKYRIDRPYFFCSNQFWIHKNHLTLLKAIQKMTQAGHSDILVAFSGKEFDPRNPEYFDSLKKFISDAGICEQIRFLGFIDRSEQLKLMSEATALIQPSLFEGWNTSIEDAKAMNQHVIASDIPVHREQLPNSSSFFEANDVASLANLMLTYQSNLYPTPDYEYDNYVKSFGATFLKIVNDVLSKES